MDQQRVQLQTLLEGLCDHVYFQPPTNIRLQYPCIVYKRNSRWSVYADNQPHVGMISYQVTVIDRDPDSEIPKSIAELQLCRFDRHFSVDDLNHDVFNLYWKGK